MTYLEPLVEYRVDGGVEVCTSEYTCKGYPKEVLSDPKSIPESVGPVIESMRTNFVTDVDLATWYKRTQLNNLISNTTVLVILISIFTHTFFYRRIVLMDNLIILRKNTSFLIKDIVSILVISITPLYSIKLSIKDVSWRYKVTIGYNSLGSGLKYVTVSIFMYPGFKKIVEYILENRQDIEISFKDSSMIDNLN